MSVHKRTMAPFVFTFPSSFLPGTARAQWKRALVKYCVCDATYAIVLRVHKRDENGRVIWRRAWSFFFHFVAVFSLRHQACNGLVYRLGNLTTFILLGQLGFSVCVRKLLCRLVCLFEGQISFTSNARGWTNFSVISAGAKIYRCSVDENIRCVALARIFVFSFKRIKQLVHVNNSTCDGCFAL